MTADPTEHELRQQYETAVSLANVPTLLLTLVHLTGDWGWMDDRYRPQREPGFSDNDTGGLSPEIQAEVRAAALEALWERRDSPPVLASFTDDELVKMLEFSMDEEVPADYGSFMADDMQRAGLLVAPDGEREASNGPSDQTAIVIGAGVSGISAGIALGEAGVDYKIIERNTEIGGVWQDATYPGAGVDTPNHLYSFAQYPHDWEYYFAHRDEIRDYLRRVADEAGVRDRITFSTDVVSARYDEAARKWNVTVSSQDGVEQTLVADILVSAVGAYNTPKYPDIKGLDSFEGDAVFHASRWDHSVDITGKKVTLVGVGATSMQAAPRVAKEAGTLTVVQRSPQWIAPFEKFATRVPDPVRQLLQMSREYQWWYRQRLGWNFNDRLHPSLRIDPEWEHPERAVNATNDRHRRVFIRYINEQLDGHPDLIEKSTPDYPPLGKRLLLDNGWYEMLRRDNVDLAVGSVAEIDGREVVTSEGDRIDTDVLVLATGYDVVRFLGTYEVVGREGRRLRDVWDDDDAKAYLGTTMSGFPNLFMLYGPNTQAGHGGSIITTLEAQCRHMVHLIGEMDKRGAEAVEVKPDVVDEYNDEIDREHQRMIWAHRGMTTYYRNSKGRVVVPIPFRNVELWNRLRADSPDNYHFDQPGQPTGTPDADERELAANSAE